MVKTINPDSAYTTYFIAISLSRESPSEETSLFSIEFTMKKGIIQRKNKGNRKPRLYLTERAPANKLIIPAMKASIPWFFELLIDNSRMKIDYLKNKNNY